MDSTKKFFSSQVHSAKQFFKTKKEWDETQDLVIVAGGREVCNADYKIERKTYPYCNIEFIASGLGYLILCDRPYTLFPGTVFAFGSHTPYTLTSDKKSPMEKFFVAFIGRKAEYFLKKIRLYEQVYHTSQHEAILHTFKELIQYGLYNSTYSNIISSRLLEVLAYKIVDTIVSHKDINSYAFATYQKCLSVIATNYLQFTTLQALADDCGINMSYMCRLFKRYDYQSPYKHIMRLKMNYAANLLLNSSDHIKNVALSMDFVDPYHFSRSFKHYMGISPQEFRTLHSQ